jgi:sec-independent protein translocase protein TatB
VFDISGWEFLTLAALAVILFGPDKLPKLAADAGKFIRMMRGYLHNARDDLTRELGPEITDVKLTDLTPRNIIRKTLGEDPLEGLRSDFDVRSDVDSMRSSLNDSLSRPLALNEVPPYDPDTT